METWFERLSSLDSLFLDLYSPARGQHFTYPPFAALLSAPFSLLPMPVFALLWTALSIAGLEASVWLCLGWLGAPSGRPRILLTGAVCVLTLLGFEPVSLERRLIASTWSIDGRFSTHSPVRTILAGVFETASKPSIPRHPSQKAEDIGARLGEQSSLIELMRTTGVPR